MHQKMAPPATHHSSEWLGTPSFRVLGGKEEHAGDGQHLLLYFYFLFRVMALYVSWEFQVISHKL